MIVVADNLCYVDSALAFLNKADNVKKDVKSVEVDIDTVVSTVSSKVPSGRFGNTCRECPHVPSKSDSNDYQSIGYDEGKKWLALHFPIRCRKCSAKAKLWGRAKMNVKDLDEVRYINGIRNLKMVTFTKMNWVLENWTRTREQLESITDDKNKLLQRHRNWRRRNKYWISRNASGKIYPEFVVKPIWKGWGWDDVTVHVHLHMLVSSKYLDNKPKKDSRGEIYQDSKMFEAWGNIVDVREVKSSYDQADKYWSEETDNEMTFWGLRNALKYVTKYVNKMDNWRSSRFGDWLK